MKHPLIFTLLLSSAAMLAAQESAEPAEEAPERVQYTLILPDEKSPELIKAEENNPFEAQVDNSIKEGDTEENRVRDILLSMPAKGGGHGPNGMRVMLGGLRLEAGQMVPPVLPDQQVMLKVKSITPKQIEMVWVEKKPTGLPPKPFVIDVDVSPRVRYMMPGNGGAKGGVGTIRMEGMNALARAFEGQTSPADSTPPPSKAVAVDEVLLASPEPSAPASTRNSTLKTSSNMPEASVLRMLFGNHAQKPR